jgi:hypothetical protein
MTAPLKVCLWATTFQANIYSVAKYLASRPDTFSVLAVLDACDRYLAEPIQQLAPAGCTLLDRADPDMEDKLAAFAPAVLVVDNHYPRARLAPALVNVWHGFGWRGPEDRDAFESVFRDVAKHAGRAPSESNPYFRWISAGQTNLEHRVHVSGFHPDNVRAAGQAFIDDVMAATTGATAWKRDELLRFYPPNFCDKKVILFAPTWHFGKIFAHWGDDIAILERLFRLVAARDAAMIVRMHDRKRFEPAYLTELDRLAERHPAVLLKYKDDHQDNLVDIAFSDVMVSNYSSILTYFYATGRPSIHVHPVERGQESSVYRYWKGGKLRTKVEDASYIWSLDPDQHGGLAVSSQDELEAALERALAEPQCCAERSRQFVADHCAPYDGRNCERVAEVIREVGEYALQHPPRSGLFAPFFRR